MATAYHMVHYRKFDTPDTELDGKHMECLCRLALTVLGPNGSSLWKQKKA